MKLIYKSVLEEYCAECIRQLQSKPKTLTLSEFPAKPLAYSTKTLFSSNGVKSKEFGLFLRPKSKGLF
jgi:hypothetical protein